MSLKFDSSGNMASKKNNAKSDSSSGNSMSDHEVSTDEEYYYTDDEIYDNGEVKINEKIKMNSKLKNEESKSGDDEDIPEYRKITEENMYEFMIWANNFKEKSIPVDYFNMILQSNLDKWVETNNITWQYALTLTSDIINTQKNIDEQFDISNCPVNSAVEEDDVYKPITPEERRKLFAAAAERRARR